MKKHGILLSLVVSFFMVFVTACENLPLEDILNGSNQGGGSNPTLSFTYEKVSAMTFKFTGDLKNANVDDYTFTWQFGNEEMLPKQGLEVEYTFQNDAAHTVVLLAVPKNPNITVPPTSYTDIVTASQSGIIVNGFNSSNLSSGLEYSFEISASSEDGSALTYTWDFGDGVKLENSNQNIVSHTYQKYNKAYPLNITITSENGKSLNVPAVEIKTSDIKAVVSVVNNPANAKSKTFSVNFYDENNKLIHGSSTEGDVEGLQNVVYNWDFGDEQSESTVNRTIEHTYESNESSVYSVNLTATTDNYEGSLTAKAEANVDLIYSLSSVSASLAGEYGLTLNVSAQGNGGESFAGREVTYKFIFPDGSEQMTNVAHDAEGNATEPAQVSVELAKYYANYTVNIQVLDNGALVAEGTAVAAKPTFTYQLNIASGSSYFNKTFTVTPVQGSFALKNAVYNWNFGDGTSGQNNASVSHTFANPGAYTVTANISSELLNETGITVKPVSKNLSLESTITINGLDCVNNGPEYSFLQYTCTVRAETTGGTLTYKWYIDGARQQNQTNKSFTFKYGKYNQIYDVKVEVGVQGGGSGIVKNKHLALKTPNVHATIQGPDNLVHGQQDRYTATTKVTHNGSTINVTLQGATYKFKIAENNTTVNTGSNNTWDRAFEPGDNEYVSNRVTRTITAEITASNLNGTITSSSKATTVSKADASLSNFQSAVVSCSPENGVNMVRQQCKVTLTVKGNAQGITGNFNQYRAKLTGQGGAKYVTFSDKAITAGATHTSSVVTFEYSWPNNGEIITGQPKSSSYTVTGYAFKNGNENNKLNATSANININLNMDYVLFPKMTGLEGKGGGSGYTFATWSCGYNEKYNNGGTLFGSKCPSHISVSGQTLRLGSLVDANGNLKGKTKFEWYMRVNKEDGRTIPDTKLKEFTINAGSQPSDEDLYFNVANAIDYREYIGSAYNSTNRVFYLKITVADENKYPLIKPIKVWYDGTNKGNYGNRLQKITPTLRENHNCEVIFEYPNQFYSPTLRYIQVFITNLRYNFDGATKYNSSEILVPSSGAFKPIIRVNSHIVGIGSKWSKSYSDDYTSYLLKSSTEDYYAGWYMYSPEMYKLRRDESGRGSTNIDMTKSSANINLVFKDMLKGSGSQLITDYYKPISCKVDQVVR